VEEELRPVQDPVLTHPGVLDTVEEVTPKLQLARELLKTMKSSSECLARVRQIAVRL